MGQNKTDQVPTLRNSFGDQVLYHSTIDSKGRLYLPAKVQAVFGKELYITLSEKDCLAIYASERWKAILDKINVMPESHRQMMRLIINYTIKCEMDNRGYIYIHKKQRERVELTSSVTIAIYKKTQKIWDGEIWASRKWVSYAADKV